MLTILLSTAFAGHLFLGQTHLFPDHFRQFLGQIITIKFAIKTIQPARRRQIFFVVHKSPLYLSIIINFTIPPDSFFGDTWRPFAGFRRWTSSTTGADSTKTNRQRSSGKNRNHIFSNGFYLYCLSVLLHPGQ
jgi:hypothetical protein